MKIIFLFNRKECLTNFHHKKNIKESKIKKKTVQFSVLKVSIEVLNIIKKNYVIILCGLNSRWLQKLFLVNNLIYTPFFWDLILFKIRLDFFKFIDHSCATFLTYEYLRHHCYIFLENKFRQEQIKNIFLLTSIIHFVKLWSEEVNFIYPELLPSVYMIIVFIVTQLKPIPYLPRSNMSKTIIINLFMCKLPQPLINFGLVQICCGLMKIIELAYSFTYLFDLAVHSFEF